ncbi:unnamed protein product [Leptidea sinapis]|uniref:Ig-like domain-containing protein n=1 Tax=Leptidea sinapis TaxID=189913 RepID=A0A5E4QJB8_9NEOP|nr:unnamed protein product [Leptidea sinapis]
MRFLCVVSLILIINENQYSTSKANSISMIKSNAASEQKQWKIKLNIYFTKILPPIIKKAPGVDVRLKCEAIMNFTKVVMLTRDKEGIETSLKELPPDHIETLMTNVKVYWLKDNKTMSESSRVKMMTKIDTTNATIGTTLRIKNLDVSDEGTYVCVIKQNFEKRLSTKLFVEQSRHNSEDNEFQTQSSSNPHTDEGAEFILDIKTTPNLVSEGIKVEEPIENAILIQNLEPICQEYVGNVCSSHLKGQFVYIPYNTTQAALEDKLFKAFQVTRYSNEISPNCEQFAKPSLCYSTFPICRNASFTNKYFFTKAKKLFKVLLDSGKDNAPLKVVFNKSPYGLQPQLRHNVNISLELFNFRYNSTVLRRVCKQDCEILENELCQREYAIAKRHPHIGQQLNLEECQDLPEKDDECLKIGIETLRVMDDECYWENGTGYLGKMNVASNGMQCLAWSNQLHVLISDYPELAGQLNYCRNPGSIKSQPWCVVDNNGKVEQLCDIPKCAHKIWIYILATFIALILVITGFILCLLRGKNKANASTIRDINLPNADKNIYGDSRLSSPVEMNDLLTNQNNVNQPHLTRNMGGCPDSVPLDSSSSCSYKPPSCRDLQERAPLLPPHCSSSNGSLATGSLKKFNVASTSRVNDDNFSTCSDLPRLAPKTKKHNSGSLVDTDKVGVRDTLVRIPNADFGNEI